MKAVVYTKYGSPDVLRLREVEKPAPKDDEVLVSIHAASLNAADLDLLKGIFMIRLGALFKPKYRILGSDIAGRVEAVGGKVKEFQPGDEVFADLTEWGFGALAEYVCVSEKALALKPVNLTFAEAAAVPAAAGIALLNLRAAHKGLPGQKVLINGAGGGMGTFAVQIAKSLGAEVTGVDKAGKLDMLRSMGADSVIDYEKEDFTKAGERYDLILDLAAHHSIFDSMRALKPNGTYAVVGGSMGVVFQTVFLGPLVTTAKGKKMGILMEYPKKKDLVSMTELIEAGKVVPVIDRYYPLDEIAEAMKYLEGGHAQGKVVITVRHDGED